MPLCEIKFFGWLYGAFKSFDMPTIRSSWLLRLCIVRSKCHQRMSKQKWWKNAIQYTVVYCCKVFFSPVCLRSILNGAYYAYNTFGHIRWRHIGNYDALVEDTSKTTRFAVWKNGFNSSSYKKSNFVQMFTFHTFFRLNSIAVFIGWNKIL